jgi:drug/metabolite transporter (DMT)-like permease
VLFGALAGALFGAMAIAVRTGLGRFPDAQVGALIVAGVAAAASIPGGVLSGLLTDVKPGSLWPFALAGMLSPGCSQILFIVAVRDAGPSRAAILIGTAPLMSVAIALVLLDEPFRPLLLAGTVLVVSGGVVLARERRRPAHFRRLGVIVALVCATLFAVRDNVVRWGARGAHAPALTASAVSLTAATVVVLAYVLTAQRDGLGSRLRQALPAFAPAGLALALAYACLFLAFDHGSVSIVAPLNATQSLWAVVFAAVVLGRAADVIGRRLFAAGLLVVAGAALIGIAH